MEMCGSEEEKIAVQNLQDAINFKYYSVLNVTQIFNFFLFHSNKLANEKVKLEELIKKSQDDCQECVKRAVKAEVQTKKS